MSKIAIITLFPEMMEPFFDKSVIGRARKQQKVEITFINPRQDAPLPHRKVDDCPYGGGAGMVLRFDVLYQSWLRAKSFLQTQNSYTIFLSPQGKLLTQQKVKDVATRDSLILVCGHYEGVDERFIEQCVDEEISIGDYILTGGEIPACALVDSMVRILPGILGNPHSVRDESFENNQLKYPHYTRPPVFLGHSVPDILLSGNHQAIEAWRKLQSEQRTLRKRPDLKK